MRLYRDESSNPKRNAQLNLAGRTHYVDDDTLRFHKSRVLRTYRTNSGLLFALIESYALDPDNQRRAFRHVIFDVFGTVISMPDLNSGSSTRAAAEKAMWGAINNIDAVAWTLKAIDAQERHAITEFANMRKKLQELAKGA